MASILNKIVEFVDLQNGEEDKKKVLENIRSSISFRGSNLWILVCAIIIASVGLNMNSTAVIIGAMLISPLMGPIVSAGFALGMFDFKLLRKAFKNLVIATAVSLAVSSVYFYLSPFKEVQSELLARTSPTIYDVLIAFFGGLVGVIAITRVEKGNPIPGVAIATALMPPLCTAGYGIATFNFNYFAGAFYLYTINCFFICIATFLVVKYLKYPPVQSRFSLLFGKKLSYGITTLLFILIIPSFYLAYNLLNEKKYTENVDKFINLEFVAKGRTVIYKKIDYNTTPKTIVVACLSKKFDQEEIKILNNVLDDYGIHDTKLKIEQDGTDVKSEILNELLKHDTQQTKTNIQLSKLENEIKFYKLEDTTLRKEITVLYPEIEEFSIGRMQQQFVQKDSSTTIPVFIYKAEEKVRIDSEKIKYWLEAKLGEQNLMVIRENY